MASQHALSLRESPHQGQWVQFGRLLSSLDAAFVGARSDPRIGASLAAAGRPTVRPIDDGADLSKNANGSSLSTLAFTLLIEQSSTVGDSNRVLLMERR